MKKSFLIILVLLTGWLVMAQSCFTFRTTDKKAIDSFKKAGIELKTTTISVAGEPLHFVQTGADSLPILIFIHGTPGSWTDFERYLKDSSLEQHYRMIALDRPGFGYSRFGNALNLADQSLLMGPLIESFKNGHPLWLVGHSLGAPVALQLALDFPGLADGLVLISGSIDPGAEKPERWRRVLEKTPLKLFLPGAFRPSNTELIYLKTDLNALRPRLSQLRLPICFIHGRADSWVPPVNVEYGMKQMIHSTSIDTLWLEGGHFIPWTAFPEVRTKLLELRSSK